MLRYKNRATKNHYVTPSDPFLYTIYGCILPIIVLVVMAILVLILRLPGFMLYAILGFVISSIFLSGSHKSKSDQINDLYYLFGLMLVGFVGTDICAQNLMLALSWIIVFAFLSYLTVIYKDVKRAYVALVVSFLPIVLHMHFPLGVGVEAFNNTQVVLTEIISISILFSVILFFAMLYPMRYRTTALISAIECIYLIRNILQKYAQKEPYADDRLLLNDYLEKLKLNIKSIRSVEKNQNLKVLLRDTHAVLYHFELLLAFGFETESVLALEADAYKNKLNTLLDNTYVVSDQVSQSENTIKDKVKLDYEHLIAKLTHLYPRLLEQRKHYA